MKKQVLMCAPFNTRSGYGDHARSIFYSIMDREDFEIKCVDVRWGETPRNHLDPKIPKHKRLLDTFIDGKNIQQPDIYIDIRIPNEFQTPAKFNIGITAGVETDVVSPEFIMGCNKMNLNLGTSKFTTGTFQRCQYDQTKEVNGQNQVVGQVKLEKPMGVLSEGIDTTIYKPIKDAGKSDDPFKKEIYDMINESFVFLHVGQWGKGKYGEDRKNIAVMIKCFLQAFANQPNPPALLLKTNGADFSHLDKDDVIKKIQREKDKFKSADSLPNIYLLHGDLTLEQMALLYNLPKIKAMLSCTHGEGFGRPLAEATCCDLPVIASGWSGQMDFLNGSDSILVNGSLEKIPKSIVWDDILISESQWFNINESKAYSALNHAFENQGELKRKGETLMYKNRENFTINKMADKLDEIMKKYTSNMPSQVGLKLPKLKKVESDKKPSIKLPKLKKVS